jgi:Cu/Ag efflux protein CusF
MKCRSMYQERRWCAGRLPRDAGVFPSGFHLPGVVAILLLIALLPVLDALADSQSQFEGKGRVVALDPANGTVTLDHGPIPGLMPPMRMRFPVQDVAQLRKLKPGDVVRFSVGNQGDALTVTAIERVEEP